MNTISMIKQFKFFLISMFLLMLFQGCSVKYSFTGASISPDIKTISIANFPNNAPLASPNLSQRFTEALRDVFTVQTNLSFVNSGGDVQLEGSITNFQTSPTAVQGNQVAATNRLTISVRVKFVNSKDEKQNFEQDFSRFADFPSDKNLASVEEQLVNEINKQLAQDIFNKAFTNW